MLPALDFTTLFSGSVLFAVVLGTVVGMVLGSLPGLGAVVAIVLVLPVTFSMDALPAVLLLLAVYQACEYGGSISAILLGIPGTGGAVVTTLDGHPLAQKRGPGLALGYSLATSTIGGIVGGLVLLFLSGPLATFALRFGAPEFTLIALLGILMVGAVSSGDVIKSMISAVLGLMAGTVGTDMFSGVGRFTMGMPELLDGFTIVAMLVGVFAIPEILAMVGKRGKESRTWSRRELRTNVSARRLMGVGRSTGVGSVLGSLTGVLPGMGAGPAAWFSYSVTKRFSKHREPYGEGNPDGVSAAESANNGAVGGGLIPVLALGIPGSPTMAVIMGTFLIHGINPGPELFTKEATLVSGVLYGFVLTTVVMYAFGRLFTPLCGRLLNVPTHLLVPTVLLFALMGVFVSRGLAFDILIVAVIGVIAFLLEKLSFSKASFILAFILSPILEENFRRALLISDGDYSIFVTRPYSLVLVIIVVGIVVFAGIKAAKQGRSRIEESATRHNAVDSKG